MHLLKFFFGKATCFLIVSMSLSVFAFMGDASAAPKHIVRIHYAHEAMSPKEIAAYEDIYGTEVVVLPEEGQPPHEPRQVSGVVVHNDPETDAKWIVGEENPAVDAYENYKELEDRWIETQFLMEHFPALLPPTSLVSEWTVRLGGRITPQNLNTLRDLIRTDYGMAILKGRHSFGSEGALPKTDQDWVALYQYYIRTTKPQIERIQKEAADVDLAHRQITNLGGREGIILEQLVNDASQVVVQKRVSIDLELRMHLIKGKLIADMTVLRFAHQTQKVLTRQLLKVIVARFQKEFVDRLPVKYQDLSASMDVIVSGDNLYLIDLNAGLTSGYFFADDHVYICNRLAEILSGAQTPFLAMLREFDRAPMLAGNVPVGARTHLSMLKEKTLHALVERFGPWARKYNPYGFWDEITDRLAKSYAEMELESDELKGVGQLSTELLRKILARDEAEFQRIMTDIRSGGFKNHEEFRQKLIADLEDGLSRRSKNCVSLLHRQ